MLGKTGSVLKSVRQHQVMMLGLAVLLSAGLAAMSFVLVLTQSQWHRTAILHDPRPEVVSRLRHHLGYGGLVHKLLDTVLRAESAQAYSTNFELGAVQAALLEYDILDLSPLERSALGAVEAELDRINVAVRLMERGDFQGISPEDIYAGLDVDLDALAAAVDTLAKVGFGTNKDILSQLELLSEFEAAIGLGGVIHHLKLYLLTRDESVLDSMAEDVAMALSLLEELEGKATSVAEREAIHIIRATINSYNDGVETAREMITAGRPASEVDFAIRVNDAPAISAYATLMSFEKLRLAKSMSAVDTGIESLKWLLIGIAVLILIPWIILFVRFTRDLQTAVPKWQSTLGCITTDLANEEFQRALDYSGLPEEFASLEQPFQEIRTTLWHRHEQSLHNASQLEVMASDTELIRAKLESAHTELDVLKETAGAAERQLKLEAQKANIIGQVVDCLSHGVLACCGLDEVVFWNRRFCQLVDIAPEWFTEARTLRDLILFLSTRGEFGMGDPTETAQATLNELEGQLENGVYMYDLKLSNNRVLALEISREDNGMVVFSATDITTRHEHAEAMQQQATSDPLTGLANRAALDTFTEAMLKHSERSGEVAAVMAIDLDGFKPVNDKYGHHAGDDLLQQIAHRLKEEARETDFVARIGGDEFIIVLLHLEDAEGALRFGQRLLRAIEMPVILEENVTVAISASVGISLFPYHAREMQPLYLLADAALYEAKGNGRNNVVMYEHPRVAAPDVPAVAPDVLKVAAPSGK